MRVCLPVPSSFTQDCKLRGGDRDPIQTRLGVSPPGFRCSQQNLHRPFLQAVRFDCLHMRHTYQECNHTQSTYMSNYIDLIFFSHSLSLTSASVAMASAASAITPRDWKANTHSSLVHTHGCGQEDKHILNSTVSYTVLQGIRIRIDHASWKRRMRNLTTCLHRL